MTQSPIRGYAGRGVITVRPLPGKSQPSIEDNKIEEFAACRTLNRVCSAVRMCCFAVFFGVLDCVVIIISWQVSNYSTTCLPFHDFFGFHYFAVFFIAFQNELRDCFLHAVDMRKFLARQNRQFSWLFLPVTITSKSTVRKRDIRSGLRVAV